MQIINPIIVDCARFDDVFGSKRKKSDHVVSEFMQSYRGTDRFGKIFGSTKDDSECGNVHTNAVLQLLEILVVT